jgi:hypothetical protein
MRPTLPDAASNRSDAPEWMRGNERRIIHSGPIDSLALHAPAGRLRRGAEAKAYADLQRTRDIAGLRYE